MLNSNWLTIPALLLFTVLNAATASTVKVAAVNVLAPSWADPALYPADVTNLLPYGPRLQRTLDFLTSNIGTVDAIAFQETEITTDGTIASSLSSKYHYFPVYHNDQYWANYITVNPPFHSNGVSIAVNKNIYSSCSFINKPLSLDGNHSAVATCYHKTLKRWFRFVSVHFDSDTGGRRGKEANAIADYLDSETTHPRYVTFIMGDFNAETDSGVIKSRLIDAGYTDILQAVGASGQTHPWTSSYNRNSQWGNIDHLIVSGEGTQSLSGKIHDSNLFELYPVITGQPGIENENARIYLNFLYTGTDHFPISGTVSVTP